VVANSAKPQAQAYTLHLQSTTASSEATTATYRRGQLGNPRHIVIPFSGKLIEVSVDEGDRIQKDEVVCVVRQMKMELEVRASRAGVVTWILEASEGDEVREGTLAAEIELLEDDQVQAKL
jgi:biotin carboxyl carrier protein